MERWDTIRADDIVLTQGQASGARGCRAQTTRVFEGKEFSQLNLWRFTQENLAEVNDSVGMCSNDDIAGNVGFVLGEDGEGMGWHGDC